MKDICLYSAFATIKACLLRKVGRGCGKRTIGWGQKCKLEIIGLADDPPCRNPMFITPGRPRYPTSIPKCKLEPGQPGVSELTWKGSL
jgi:hypothetical protein